MRTMKKPFLTVGIANYNYGKYLVHGWEQIKKQNYSDFEVLYCDDGSTDCSIQIIRQIIKDNPQYRIRLIEGDNKGILANRNRILDHAEGEYLMICDADDYMLPLCLKSLCETAKKHHADCVIGGFVEEDCHGRLLKRHIPPHDACKWLYTWHHAQIYRMDLVRQKKLRFLDLPDDVFFLQQIHQYSFKVVFVHRSLYAWVRHSDSTSTDIMANPDWHPYVIWKKLSFYIATLCKNLSVAEKSADSKALKYYLYKWYYFNILDLPWGKFSLLQAEIYRMRKQMYSVFPSYSSWHTLRYAIRTRDTHFARTAVLICWIAEKFHMLPFLVLLRTIQHLIKK